jgi:hypothetical protein
MAVPGNPSDRKIVDPGALQKLIFLWFYENSIRLGIIAYALGWPW